MSNRIHLSRIPIMLHGSLPSDAREALIVAKNRIRANEHLRVFGNQQGAYDGDGSPLPQLSAGCVYHEFNVGQAHENDPRRAGKKRLVIEFHASSRRVMNIYYTENHYLKFSFYRIV